MIDGIKIYDLKTNPDHLESNPYLLDYWTTTVQNANGLVKYGLAEYFGLKFQIKHSKVRLQGSLHKYYNEGRHNYNDFTAVNVEEVVKELSERFKIDTTQTELNNVEFGVNIVLPFDVSLVINNLIVYKGEPFMRVVEEGMNYYQCKKTHFIIKIYDKGKQYKLTENVLRFEIKVIKMQYLKTKGVPIRYLSDLLNKSIYESLGNILMEVFERILFSDNTLNEKCLSTKEREVYLRSINPKTWKPQTEKQSEWKKLQRLETSYQDILERHRTGINFRLVVAELIRKKSLEMSTFYREIENVLSLGNVHFLHFSYSVNTGHLESTSTDRKDRLKLKLCSGCGKPLERNQTTYHNKECQKRKFERNKKSNLRNFFKKKYGNVNETIFLF